VRPERRAGTKTEGATASQLLAVALPSVEHFGIWVNAINLRSEALNSARTHSFSPTHSGDEPVTGSFLKSFDPTIFIRHSRLS